MDMSRDKTKKLVMYLIFALIGVMGLVIGGLLIKMVSNSTPQETTTTTPASDTPSTATSSNDHPEEEPVPISYSSQTSESHVEDYLANEVTELMKYYGVANTDVNGTVYATNDLVALTESRTDQVAPPPGIYKVIRLFEQGVEKDISSLNQLGRGIYFRVNANNTVEFNFMGLEFDGTYDNHYIYTDDGNAMPYVWDGTTATATAHRLEADAVLDNSPETQALFE